MQFINQVMNCSANPWVDESLDEIIMQHVHQLFHQLVDALNSWLDESLMSYITYESRNS